MSDGMSDARAEGELYLAVKWAVCDVRDLLQPARRERLDHALVGRVSELLSDLGWRLQLARYAEPRQTVELTPELADELWDAVAKPAPRPAGEHGRAQGLVLRGRPRGRLHARRDRLPARAV